MWVLQTEAKASFTVKRRASTQIAKKKDTANTGTTKVAALAIYHSGAGMRQSYEERQTATPSSHPVQQSASSVMPTGASKMFEVPFKFNDASNFWLMQVLSQKIERKLERRVYKSNR